MFDKISQIWKAKDLRKNIIFVLLMLTVFRLTAHIPVPGVNTAALKSLFSSNQVLGLLDLFSGGGMQNFSIMMMGIAPYITSSIIFQLLAMVIPALEEMQKEESGRAKINMWTRWATVPLAIMQSYGMVTLLRRSTADLMTGATPFDIFVMIITITAGTIFLMWIGELITEKNIGNGISLLIFAGIVSKLPRVIQQTMVTYDSSKLFVMISFVAIAVITVIGIVIMNEGQRNIPVQHARQIRGNRTYGGTTTHLPLRVNMAGVIPIIFAISVILFPTMVAQFFIHAKTAWIAGFAQWTIDILRNHPDRIAENLQKQGAFIPGIRPGNHTQEYLAYTAHRIIFAGAIFLGSIAILPLVMKYFTGVNSLAIGGTSILIVVSVVIETVKQIESQLTMREYENT